jgi:hypothetical protein
VLATWNSALFPGLGEGEYRTLHCTFCLVPDDPLARALLLTLLMLVIRDAAGASSRGAGRRMRGADGRVRPLGMRSAFDRGAVSSYSLCAVCDQVAVCETKEPKSLTLFSVKHPEVVREIKVGATLAQSHGFVLWGIAADVLAVCACHSLT